MTSARIHTVRVTDLADTDPLGEDVCAEIRRTVGLQGLRRVRTARVYRLQGIDREAAGSYDITVRATSTDTTTTTRTFTITIGDVDEFDVTAPT